MYNYSALNQYRSVDVQSKVAASSPHSLVAMLLDGILHKLALASGAMERADISAQGQALSGGIRIVDSLRASLDYNKGGELAKNLGAIYDYIERRLLEANASSDPGIISEVRSLIDQIKSGWDAIPPELRGVD